MGATRWDTARRDITIPLGSVIFDSEGIGAGKTIPSAELRDRFPDDGIFDDWFVIVGGTTQQHRNEGVYRVTDYVGSTGTLTIAGINLVPQSGQTCELHKFDPQVLRRHFNQASRDLYPYLCVIREHEVEVTDPEETRYSLPTNFDGPPRRVGLSEEADSDVYPLRNSQWSWLPPVAGQTNVGGYIVVPNGLLRNCHLRVIGTGRLSEVTANDDTVEIDGSVLQTLYAKTRHYIARELAWQGRPEEREGWVRAAGTLRREVDQLLRDGHYVRRPARHAVGGW